MNQEEFLRKWNLEKPIYEAWGQFIALHISSTLEKKGLNPKNFLKIPVVERLKEDNSLIDKAFIRKTYGNPYNEIEDKVGLRFVVLLTDEIKTLIEIITSDNSWIAIHARDYEKEKEEKPLLFAYQSMHFILRPSKEFEFNSIRIPTDTPCEVQIRTLLQHAHAELTHDAIYKSSKKIKPHVNRTVSKCMALIETTDDFFCAATKALQEGPASEFKIVEKLDSLFLIKIGLHSYSEKSSIIIFDTFEQFITEDLIDNINKLLNRKPYLIEKIKVKYSIFKIYQQSVILFAYWLIDTKKRRTQEDWPLDRKILELLATDLGISLDN
ncbi:Uncharacterized protein conserved in bacteria [Acinetobacter baumannii]|uniref:GTP pyrophosphokinase n=1 Tax=Acinetobacter baumannii TaxID=470 RepID=UPI000DE779A2|nr:(p)ppGpp synthetase [Acinetobacter baumannii]MBJ9577487.1 hypothetical protein [Acinetobacter baumannii]MCT9423641.1 hypothetical protein [Acinetobacter baumannii]UDY21371.1 hypothetical protein NLHDIDDJ_03038 [Acinetobacter baumannii]SSS46853.1 Uncharacterized protein conserved in bacteria [Acinetobacter baumannii]